jgi:hypothetical protein
VLLFNKKLIQSREFEKETSFHEFKVNICLCLLKTQETARIREWNTTTYFIDLMIISVELVHSSFASCHISNSQ